VVTSLAAGYQIIPRRLPSARARLDVIERELGRRVLLAAILAGRVVTQQDVLSRERTPFERNVNVLGESNHRRCMDSEFLRMKYVAVVFFDPRYALENHHDGTPLRAHVDGLIGGIQD
jgi:hypothetical protein